MKFIQNSLICIIELTIIISTSSIKQEKFAKQKVQTNIPCKIDADCIDHAFCFGNDDTVSGKCKCLEGYDLISNSSSYECIKGAPLGEPCKRDMECKIQDIDSFCNNQNGLCECVPDAYNFDGSCYQKSKLGDVCLVDNNCFLANGTHGYCVDGRCKCGNNMKPSTDRTRCLRSRILGQDCLTDEECTDANSKCYQNCDCFPEYVLYTSGTNNTCIKAATKFGESCQFDVQCSKFLRRSICINGNCTCPSEYHEYGSKCVKQIKSEQIKCKKDENCYYEDAQAGVVQCIKEKCKCLYGVKANGLCNLERVDNSSTKVTIGVMLILIFTSLGVGIL